HTRFSRDWSSDVCSSDLLLLRMRSLMQAKLLLVAWLWRHKIRLLILFHRLGQIRSRSLELCQGFLSIMPHKLVYFTLIQEANFMLGRMDVHIDIFRINF